MNQTTVGILIGVASVLILGFVLIPLVMMGPMGMGGMTGGMMALGWLAVALGWVLIIAALALLLVWLIRQITPQR